VNKHTFVIVYMVRCIWYLSYW